MAAEDPWLERATELHDILSEREVDHIWQVYPGVHEYTYWHEHAVDYLRFYSNALSRGHS
jgi:enterochelin esterase-like enzyme